MLRYQCIACGREQDLPNAECCPECGHKMYALPYDRKDALRQEILASFSRLAQPLPDKDELEYYRMDATADGAPAQQKVLKASDDARFPDYRKIYEYVCNASRTEIFCARLNEVLSRFQSHLHTSYAREYQVDFSDYRTRVALEDKELKKALATLSLPSEIEAYTLPDVRLHYTEVSEPARLAAADALLDTLTKLTAKLETFVRQNNLYGVDYTEIGVLSQEEEKAQAQAFEQAQKRAGEMDASDFQDSVVALLTDCLHETDAVLKKQYMLDVLADGREELTEMLHALWKAMALILSAPVLCGRFEYQIADDAPIPFDAMASRVAAQCAARCRAATEIMAASEFWEMKSEEQLFTLYDALMEQCAQNRFGVSGHGMRKTGSGERQLLSLIGLDSVKTSVLKIKAYALANKQTGRLNLHMCFMGNPGTGKTEVARLIGKILHENGILPTDHFVEVDRGDLVGEYMGETAQKTKDAIQRAMGGVLFVDEAYALIPKGGSRGDYGHEAVATLMKAMEDARGAFCVILAGYKNEMQQMLQSNPGFVSRIQFMLDFPDYDRTELEQIMLRMVSAQHYTIQEDAVQKAMDILDIEHKKPAFANARALRNLLDQVIMCQSVRVMGAPNRVLECMDVEAYIRDNGIVLPLGEGAKRVLTGVEELEQLIGLTAVKRMVKKIRAYAVRNRKDESFNLHMCFCGNPGTGKTEVARILSRIFYDCGVLPEAKLIETDAHGLLGQYVGETAPKTLEKINEARGGVLFIDEAYALVSSSSAQAHYGNEALAVLLKEMEDRRGQFCVIFAGYPNEMQTMLSANPGLESRIQFRLNFPDYTQDELGAIAERFLRKKGYEIHADALALVLALTDHMRNSPGFANARTVRNILEQVILNQNLRTEETTTDSVIIAEDVESYLEEEGIALNC